MTSQCDLASIARAVIDTNSYMTLATAAEMTPGEQLEGIEVFSARSRSLGSKPWTPEEVCAPASLRLYRASVSELFVIDSDDQRMRAEIGE
jgi:hypothetical protein